ncbi:FMN-dependent NADH-azoreductase [Actimicrobium sp. CCI2.3]|uniref:FMN-dependent NADH-azoreductase n=1 Tax=Actimicrobium sp. CCI2.3 TaxID=3048616 RepID=UPI002AB4E0F7|nr:FMN-dependent NADH-azoreductase [Actimicrobium sp. CCI2.3]MDY7573855.1 FMN-dependent NADH-azoreductase [Actimicrobium sp. CCI2.3]MEB0023423.1 FMN-dependent NADH-azoreductase [Actimicrobium sp. CCI2.3]
MTTILHINSSARTNGSISRDVTAEFITRLQAADPAAVVVERDVASTPLPHLTEQVLGAFFTSVENRSAQQSADARLSDTLVSELKAADIIVIGAPMYNFSVTSSLKAWIDHVARAGQTFQYTEKGPVGLLTGKKVFVFTARGGVYSSGPAQGMDFHETYLRAVLGFMGLDDITFVHSEGLAMGEEAVTRALTQTRSTMAALIPV